MKITFLFLLKTSKATTYSQYQLPTFQLDEVSALNQSVILLEQKLTEAEAARLDLISNRWQYIRSSSWSGLFRRQRLENDLRVKENSISIDQSKCMTLRWGFSLLAKKRGQTNWRIVCRAHPFVLPPGWTFHSTSDAVSHRSVSLAGGRISFIPPPLDLFPIYSYVSRWGLFVRLFYFQKVPGCCRHVSSNMWAQPVSPNNLWAET